MELSSSLATQAQRLSLLVTERAQSATQQLASMAIGRRGEALAAQHLTQTVTPACEKVTRTLCTWFHILSFIGSMAPNECGG